MKGGVSVGKNVLLGGSLIIMLAGCGASNSAEEKPAPVEDHSVNKDNNVSEETAQPSETNEEQSKVEENKDSDSSNQESLTAQEVIQATKEQLKTEVPVKLPENITISPNQHLTAKTSSGENGYIINFIETDEPVPINNEALKDKEANVAVLKGTKYKTNDQAAEQINYQNHSENGAPAVDLGYGIKGYSDAGAGSQFIGWNEGRWSLAMRALTEQGNVLPGEAKKIVQYLEKNTLPIPHDRGAAMLDISKTDGEHTQRIAWQDNNIVYEVETTKGYMEALEIAVSIRKNK